MSRAPEAPDVLVPAQWEAQRAQLSPERRLVLAVLAEAVSCLERQPEAPPPAITAELHGKARDRLAVRWARYRRECRDAAEVRAWLRRPPGPGGFSFTLVAETLGVEPAVLRRRLEALAPSRHRGPRPQSVRR